MKHEVYVAGALSFVLVAGVASEKCWRKSPPHTHNELQIPEQFSSDAYSAFGTPTVQWLQPFHDLRELKK